MSNKFYVVFLFLIGLLSCTENEPKNTEATTDKPIMESTEKVTKKNNNTESKTEPEIDLNQKSLNSTEKDNTKPIDSLRSEIEENYQKIDDRLERDNEAEQMVQNARKEAEGVQKRAQEKVEEMLDKAKENAQKIMDNAQDKAKEASKEMKDEKKNINIKIKEGKNKAIDQMEDQK